MDAELTCRVCKQPSSSWYWHSVNGQKTNDPTCPDCYERRLHRASEERLDDYYRRFPHRIPDRTGTH